MKTSFLLVAVLAASVADARPSRSQHPRVGQLTEVSFATGSASLAEPTSQELGEVASWAQENPDGIVVLNGHARRGEARNVVALSMQRARVVRDQLVQLGVDPDIIVIAAFGSDGPQHADDRRVTVWGTHHDVQTATAPLRQARAVVHSNLLRTRSTTTPRGR
jgi:outer membrane protein OmpA-like peptidoglycan-associated protein